MKGKPQGFAESLGGSVLSSWPRYWLLNVSLFVATLITTTAFGSALFESFAANRPLGFDLILSNYLRLFNLDHRVFSGLLFSVPLLLILLAHELGHYVECRKRDVDASLPYFLPSPFLLGTFGAFIRIRSPIYTRRGLFDIGIGGPLSGFAMLLPFLVYGVAQSKTVSLPAGDEAIVFGTPLALRLAEGVFFPQTPATHIVLHPIAMAAWAGLFATALNLLPIGQLDGGHILYALGSDSWHRRVSLTFVFLLAIAGFFYWPWWIWGVVMFFFGRRHPLIYDDTPLSGSRLALCLAAVLIFVLSLTVVPVRAT